MVRNIFTRSGYKNWSEISVLSSVQQIWSCLDRYDQFWAINRKLMETTTENPFFRYVPFRIYQPDRPLVQTLIRPVDEEGRRVTLEQLLRKTLPDAGDRTGT